MVFEFKCNNGNCDGMHECLCPDCEGPVDLVEKVGPVFYCECHKCNEVFWTSDNEYSTPEKYPRTLISRYDNKK